MGCEVGRSGGWAAKDDLKWEVDTTDGKVEGGVDAWTIKGRRITAEQPLQKCAIGWIAKHNPCNRETMVTARSPIKLQHWTLQCSEAPRPSLTDLLTLRDNLSYNQSFSAPVVLILPVAREASRILWRHNAHCPS